MIRYALKSHVGCWWTGEEWHDKASKARLYDSPEEAKRDCKVAPDVAWPVRVEYVLKSGSDYLAQVLDDLYDLHVWQYEFELPRAQRFDDLDTAQFAKFLAERELEDSEIRVVRVTRRA